MSEQETAASRLLALLTESRANTQNELKIGEDSENEILKKILLKKLQASSNLSKEDKIQLLKKRFDSFLEPNEFSTGMLVCWKPGLRNKGAVDYNQPAIVLEKLIEPIYDEEKGSGSPYFKEPLDLILGFLDEDNDFITFYADSRRFMPYTP